MSVLQQDKTDLIDRACKDFGVESFADLGAVWGVAGGYTFYTLEKYHIEKAFLVDTGITDEVREKKKEFPQLSLIEANFGSPEVSQKIATVGAIIMFDVLLHQVAPDWDEVIRNYSKNTDHFVIYNQQYTGPETVRLIDLGEEEYFENVPHTKDEEPYKTFLAKMYEMHPEHNRIYRDIHNVWQWGIIDDDLVAVMRDVGFEQVYYKNFGLWGGLKNCEGHGFIFKKRG